MRRLFTLLAAVLAALLVAACAQDVDRKPAESAVTQFHHRLDAGQFETIYDDAAPAFRNAVRKDTFLALLASVHGTLGAVKKADEKHWSTKLGDSSAMLTLQYTTAFNGGDADERFIWRLEGDSVQLAGYQVTSKALDHN
jgi:opacity protein-like surface antigen